MLGLIPVLYLVCTAATAARASFFYYGGSSHHASNTTHRMLERGQYGTNNCGTKDSKTSKCQNLYIKSLQDFCLFAPPYPGTVGDTEAVEVSYCLNSGHGARLIPSGTFKSAHFQRTPDYIQITGTGSFTKLNIPKGDEGGELDNHGADNLGNPVGGKVLVYIDGAYKEATDYSEFISDREVCIRACFGKNSRQNCQHIYDEMGCAFNQPGNYGKGFDLCHADDTEFVGTYTINGQVSTYAQGSKPTPAPHPAAKSSGCSKASSLSYKAYTTAKAVRRDVEL